MHQGFMGMIPEMAGNLKLKQKCCNYSAGQATSEETETVNDSGLRHFVKTVRMMVINVVLDGLFSGNSNI